MSDAAALRQTIVDCVLALAPEADFTRVDPKRSLREQLDLDSFDFLNLLIALHERTGVQVPEADYRRVDSLDGMAAYLARGAAAGAA
jgi:acyl carrier protein